MGDELEATEELELLLVRSASLTGEEETDSDPLGAVPAGTGFAQTPPEETPP
jgi:hypothetical protein